MFFSCSNDSEACFPVTYRCLIIMADHPFQILPRCSHRDNMQLSTLTMTLSSDSGLFAELFQAEARGPNVRKKRRFPQGSITPWGPEFQSKRRRLLCSTQRNFHLRLMQNSIPLHAFSLPELSLQDAAWCANILPLLGLNSIADGLGGSLCAIVPRTTLILAKTPSGILNSRGPLDAFK